MTLTARIAWDDTVLPFQLDRSGIRGRVLRLDSVLEGILARHAYPAPVEALVAEAAILTALIGHMIKLRWRLSLQIRGDGPLHLIATDYFAPADPAAPAEMRAYAGFDATALAGAGEADVIGSGHFAITIDQGRGMRPYQGITPIAGDSLSASAESYFAQSEQLPTRFALTAARAVGPDGTESWRGGGVMLQKMPRTSRPAADGGAGGEGGLLQAGDLLSGDEAEDWARANHLLDTVEAAELIGPGVQPPDLLLRLFHEEGPRVFEARAITAGCTCSRGRVLHSIAAHNAEEIAGMVTPAGVITADCQFCGAHYEIDPAELAGGGDDG